MKLVRQKERRKSSVLYCPESCEEDMVYTSFMQDDTSEMDNTMMKYKTANRICNSIANFIEEKETHNYSMQHKRGCPDQAVEPYMVDFGGI